MNLTSPGFRIFEAHETSEWPRISWSRALDNFNADPSTVTSADVLLPDGSTVHVDEVTYHGVVDHMYKWSAQVHEVDRLRECATHAEEYQVELEKHCALAAKSFERLLRTILGDHHESHGWETDATAAARVVVALREELAQAKERLTNEIGLRVLTEILLEEAGGRAFNGERPPDEDLPRMLRFSMQETLNTAESLRSVLVDLDRLKEELVRERELREKAEANAIHRQGAYGRVVDAAMEAGIAYYSGKDGLGATNMRAETAEALILRWNKAASELCAGSEYINDPERVFARLKDSQSSMMGVLCEEKRRTQTAEAALAVASERIAGLTAALTPCRSLIAAMETCHICKSSLLIQEWPVYCEDSCSADCEDHEEPSCEPLDRLHAKAKAALAAAGVDPTLDKSQTS